MKRGLVLLLAGLLLAGCGSWRHPLAGFDLRALLPESGEVPGLVRDGESQEGQGLAGLAEVVDGAAERLVDLSARRGVFQDYVGEGSGGDKERVSVAIYLADDAERLYRGIYEGRSETVSGIGDAARVRLDLFGASALDFFAGPYYVELVSDRGGPDGQARLFRLAAAILGRMP